jgi:hypothetical protein
MMDKRLVREYCERYRAVEEVDRAAFRASSIAFRLQQVNSLYKIARSLGFPMESRLEDDLPAYERWARLKRRAE